MEMTPDHITGEALILPAFMIAIACFIVGLFLLARKLANDQEEPDTQTTDRCNVCGGSGWYPTWSDEACGSIPQTCPGCRGDGNYYPNPKTKQ